MKTLLRSAEFAVRSFPLSASSAMNSRILLSSMPILMNAPKQHSTYATLQPSISIEMEKGLMRCLAQEKRDCMIAYGCILDGYLSVCH
ncbi:hypothetical protein U9M48_033453 [Paspalum notatum var. saurae]|uniref:Uncharacterized protein n=1 Tax=Paspalum notatum var. saurae TaxID=547442 RepID=A0AAQ3U9R1_PASNO